MTCYNLCRKHVFFLEKSLNAHCKKQKNLSVISILGSETLTVTKK